MHMDLCIRKTFRVANKIASGSFGDVYAGIAWWYNVAVTTDNCVGLLLYKGTNIHTGTEVAIKLEDLKGKHRQLQREAKIYGVLARGCEFRCSRYLSLCSLLCFCGLRLFIAVGIPSVKWSGREGDYNVLVLDMLGPSLEDLFNYCGNKFSLKTVLLLADEMISRLEFVHSRSYIHRDVRPDNFVMGVGSRKVSS